MNICYEKEDIKKYAGRVHGKLLPSPAALSYLLKHFIKQCLQKLWPQEIVIGWQSSPRQMLHSSMSLGSRGESWNSVAEAESEEGRPLPLPLPLPSLPSLRPPLPLPPFISTSDAGGGAAAGAATLSAGDTSIAKVVVVLDFLPDYSFY